ncbi:MAG: isopeptide-forming domain-containing fimbrial protein [Lachnospiraceae bacterium]|nr:isopeptide-forming domain-containing fimbrial protein [Lachnospiraceae bacterium]
MKMKRFSKAKKIMAGILSATMVLSSMVVAGLADTANGSGTTDAIDTTKKVSFTIHRYKDDGTGTLTFVEGTGKETTAPTGAVPVSGVQYSVYKVADITQTAAPYETKYAIVAAYAASLTGETAVAGELTDADNAEDIYNTLTTAGVLTGAVTGTTNASGEVTFGNRAGDTNVIAGQGLYLVVETNSGSDSYTVEPFFVSLPTTIDYYATSGEATGSEWLYDVNVYPKTIASTGGITLKKYGATAGDLSTKSALTGATFYIQKQNGANWDYVTSAAGTNISDVVEGGDTKGVVTVSSTAGVTISGLAAGTYRFVEKSAPKGYIVDGNNTYVFTIDAYGNVAGPNVTAGVIEVINEKPTIEKEVLKKDGTYGEYADYTTDGSDEVTFKISVTVPTNVKELATFKMVDEFEKTQFNAVAETDVTLTYYDDADTEITGIDAKESYTANDASAAKGGFTLNFDKDVLGDNNVAKIEAVFTTTLKTTANTAGEGNINTGKLEYTNHVYPASTDPTMPNPDPGYEERTEITDQAGVYTFGFNVEKLFQGTSKDGSGNYPAGFTATFDLYRKAYAGETGVTAGGVSDLIKIGTYTTGADGTITVQTGSESNSLGLANSTATNLYYLVETDTADGYNLLDAAVPVTINVTYSGRVYPKTITVKKYDATGALIETIETTETTNAGSVVDTTTYANETVTINITNKKGFTFPQTGGTGTIIFTIIGLILMIGGVSIYFTARKRKNITN